MNKKKIEKIFTIVCCMFGLAESTYLGVKLAPKIKNVSNNAVQKNVIEKESEKTFKTDKIHESYKRSADTIDYYENEVLNESRDLNPDFFHKILVNSNMLTSTNIDYVRKQIENDYYNANINPENIAKKYEYCDFLDALKIARSGTKNDVGDSTDNIYLEAIKGDKVDLRSDVKKVFNTAKGRLYRTNLLYEEDDVAKNELPNLKEGKAILEIWDDGSHVGTCIGLEIMNQIKIEHLFESLKEKGLSVDEITKNAQSSLKNELSTDYVKKSKFINSGMKLLKEDNLTEIIR